MHSAHSIVPLLIGFMISVLVHAGLLGGRGSFTDAPRPVMDSGRTVVRLTLQTPEAVINKQTSPKPPQPHLPEPMPPEPVSPLPDEVQMPDPQPKEASTPKPPPPEVTPSSEPDRGVTTAACAVNAIQPRYPRISRRRAEQGSVVIHGWITPDGRAVECRVARSSGYARLDEAALEAFQAASFIPAMKNGTPVRAALDQTFTFRLTHD